MMFGALPPSSSVSFFSSRPVRVESACRLLSMPVKAILSTSGWDTSAAPVPPAPVMMFTTPCGKSASWMISASINAVSGVVSAGFSTTVFPAASAGAIFHAAISSGKFQGMICPATPSGARLRFGKRVLELVRPARVIEKVRRGKRDVDIARLFDRLAAVHRLEHRQCPRLFLNQPGDAEDVFRPLGRPSFRHDFS